MSESFEMVPEDIINHAVNVQSIGAELAKVATRGESVELGTETYGLIGQVFSVPVRIHIALIAKSVNELASALPDIADALRDCADTTQQTDDDHAKLFGKFMGE
ncbi:type VII secretion target [Saccharothrix xinjiangensis]|uniref:Type VII secretion target n=1 Tax=Saccharothrix xinjiangensis TaxID=204798 RepID=A0ABV9XVW2_9PSEU